MVERIGLNARFDTIQAAVILAKLGVFEGDLDAATIGRIAGIVRKAARG